MMNRRDVFVFALSPARVIRSLRGLTLIFALCALPLTVSAQTATATLSGTLTDQNGAIVPEVEVTVINAGTSLQRHAKTNNEGYFTVPLLPPGTYSITARRTGFYTVQVPEFVLNVGDEKTLKMELKVGNVNETVKVTDEPSLISEAPGVATVVDRHFVGNLPLNGRSFQSLINLSPGVVLTKATAQEQGQFSVNGQRADANYFTVDGVSANVGVFPSNNSLQSVAGSTPALSAAGGTNNLVSVDALEEFRIQTSSYAAEFGRTPGAQVQLITRAGTNQFHGSIFEFLRNEKLDANDWFNNARRLPKPPLRQNDFGGVIGGPIIKNRTFFFFSYEGLRLQLPQSRSSDVPSVAARQAAPAAVKPILNAYPVPNGPERLGTNGLPNGFAVFDASYSDPSKLNATAFRIDHSINQKASLFGRYNYAPSQADSRGLGTTTLNTTVHTRAITETLTGGATFSFSSTAINELRLNYSRNSGFQINEADNFGGAVVPADSIIFPAGTSRESDVVSHFITGSANGSFLVGSQTANTQRQFNLVDNLSMARGAHQLKFGVDYRRLTPTLFPNGYNALIQFNGVGTPGAATQPPGSALSGTSAGAVISSSPGKRFPLFTNFSLYGQDTWKMTPRLTLNFGLRWEVNPPPNERTGKDAVTVIGLDNPATATLAPPGTPLWKTTYNNFAPRVGVAFQLSQKPGQELILRGGAGLFYDLGAGTITNAFGINYPFAASKTILNIPFPLSATDAAPPVVGIPITGMMTVAKPDLKLPRVWQWNFAVERALGIHQTVTASYVAAVGRRLLRLERLFGTASGGTLNPAVFSGTAQVFLITNTATSDYHALQVQFKRRLSRGLQGLASYTWGHSIDIASADSFFFNLPSGKSDPGQDRGPSDFDVRHAFNAAVSYDIPRFNAGPIGNAILRGWSIDSIFYARSATPVNVTYTRSLPGIGTQSLRPDLIAGIPLYLSDPTVGGGQRFNNTPPSAAQLAAAGCAAITASAPAKGAFCTPVTARQGTLGRNAMRGFSVYQVDFAIRRQFKFDERIYLQFKAEFFNIFNHPNFADPVGSLSLSTYGTSQSMLGRSLGSGGVSGGFNPLYQIGGPRSVQLSLKLGF